jgi:hypothetical protein
MLTRTLFPETSESLTLSQHHLKAANHLDIAARAHMEAARLFESGEQKAAELQIDIARVNVLRAGLQVIEAGKKMSPSGFPSKGPD